MPFKKEVVEAPLIQRYGLDEGSKLFQKFLEKGVISADGFLYCVPIPSMHDWMKLELKRTQERLREMEATQDRSPDVKTIGPTQEMSPSAVVPEERSTHNQPTQSMENDHGIQGWDSDSVWDR